MAEDPVDAELLRPLLLEVVKAARANQKDPKSNVRTPRMLEPLVKLTRLNKQNLKQMRDGLEVNEEFRQHIAKHIEENQDQEAIDKHIGRAGWLWLSRPDGWEEEFKDLADAAEHSQEEEKRAHEMQRLRESEKKAKEKAKRAERAKTKAEKECDEAHRGLDKATEKARKATEKVGGLQEALKAAETRQQAIEDELEKAQREHKREQQHLLDQKKEVEKELQRLKRRHRKDMKEAEEALKAAESAAADRKAATVDFDPQHLEDILSEVAQLSETYGDACKDAVDALVALLVPEKPDRVPAAPKERKPHKLPGGLLDDSLEAAKYLLSVPNVMVLVDGYNAMFKKYPQFGGPDSHSPNQNEKNPPLREVRARFMRSVKELNTRTRAEMLVVFDGTQTDYDYNQTTARSLGLRVHFSKPGETADDVIVELCDKYPTTRPIVVVTEDAEVREGAKKRGANLLHSNTFIAYFNH